MEFPLPGSAWPISFESWEFSAHHSFSFWLLPPPQSVDTFIVDWTQQTPGTDFQTISAALDSAQNPNLSPGDTILVKGLVDAQGNPAAYAERDPSTASAMENFPLPMAEGVTLKPYDSVPVYIWSDGSGGLAPTLVRYTDDGDTSTNGVTRIEDITFAGGAIAIDMLEADGASHTLLLKDCTFVGNAVGVSVQAEANAAISVAVRYCQLAQASVTTSNPPDLQPVAVGFRFRAFEQLGTTGFGEVNAEILSLSTAGTFTNMASSGADWAWPSNDHDFLRNNVDGATRMIECYAKGYTAEHRGEAGGAMAIPEVNLTMSGDLLDGTSASESQPGWDLGLYANASFGTAQEFDYQAGYSVTVTETEFENFHLAGVYAAIDAEARGDMVLQDVVIDTVGPGASTLGMPYAHSGIHAMASDGYLRLKATDCEVLNATGNGIMVHVPETQAVPQFKHPVGCLVKLTECKLHDNDGNGIEFATGRHYLANGKSGIAGGTLDRLGGSGPSMVFSAVKPGSPVDHGEGLVLDTEIHDNEGHGIAVNIRDSGSPIDAVNARFINTFVWGNDGDGYRAEVNALSANGTYSNAYLLTPLVHCTFALNQGWSGELVQNTSYRPKFQWTGDPYVSLPFRHDPKTAFINSIFERTSSGLVDFNASLELAIEADTAADPDEVGCSGSRYVRGQGASVQPPVWTDLATPFAYIGNGTLVGVERYFLDPAGQFIGSFQNSTSMNLLVHAPESSADFEGTVRPSAGTGNRDKGGDEL